MLLVLPADHVIRDVRGVPGRGGRRRAAAEAGSLVTFGVVPTGAETGYGYIRRGAGSGPAFTVAQFVEKPDAATARSYVDSGEYYWNSGMFMFRASAFLDELERHAPAILAAAGRRSPPRDSDLDFLRLPRAGVRGLSVRLDRLRGHGEDRRGGRGAARRGLERRRVVVGACGALPRDCGRQRHRRRRDRRGHAAAATCTRPAAWSRPSGLRDHVVVETKDAVLVAPRDRVQDVKELVAQLKARGRYETSLHREVYRPWGSYDSIDSGRALPGQAPDRQARRHDVAAAAPPPRRALGRRLRHRRITRGDEVFLLERKRVDLHPDRRRSIASRIPARFRCTSSRCSPAATSARTTSSASRTGMVATRPDNVIILTGGLTGSSALAGLLAAAGYWSGEGTFRKRDYNTYENSELIRLNRQLMQRAGAGEEYTMRSCRTRSTASQSSPASRTPVSTARSSPIAMLTRPGSGRIRDSGSRSASGAACSTGVESGYCCCDVTTCRPGCHARSVARSRHTTTPVATTSPSRRRCEGSFMRTRSVTCRYCSRT